MINRLFKRILEPRHFWRTAGFDELSELYVAQFLRSLGVNLVGLFIPIYLYKIGYSLSQIAFYFVCWFVFRVFFDYLSARFIAKYGPKHGMLVGCLMHSVYLGLVLTIKTQHWPFILVASVGSFAYGMHILALQVDFSKIKHVDHGGKELGFLSIVDKLGGVVGPLVGGLLANYFDPRYTVALAGAMLLLSAVPLFFSKEPVVKNQTLDFRGIPYKERYRDYLSAIPNTIENAVTLIIWPLYVSIFIFKRGAFAKLGIITAVSVLGAILLTRAIGSLIDNSKGLRLLRIATVLNALVHLTRPFAGSTAAVLAINVANEPITAAYRMPYYKGLFDAADSLPGRRISYLTTYGMVDSLTRLVFWLFVWLALSMYSGHSVFVALFFVAALCSLGIMLEKFDVLHQKT
jgi:hypothetical protein